jgi:protein arginine kinase activator
MSICEQCKKAQATFHLTNIETNGEKIERHLCERCAIAAGLLQPKPTVAIGDFWSKLMSSKVEVSELMDLACPECGLTFVEFRNQGLLGCPNDYTVFRAPLLKMIEQAHDGATHHVGKTPHIDAARKSAQLDLKRLRRQLDDAVVAEDYERAAELRDRIREMEKQ